MHEVFYIFNKSKIVVTNDSGGYHIAMSVSDNIIVISSGGSFIRFISYPKEIIKNKVDKLAWWIPIRKWRDWFRNKFNV